MELNALRPAAAARILAARLPRRTALSRLAGGASAGLLASFGLPGAATWRAAAQPATPPAGALGYGVLRRYQLVPDAATDTLVQRVEEGFVSIVSGIPGFQEYLLLETGAGEHVTMSIFADPAAAEQSTRAAAGWAAENVAEFIQGPPEVTTGWIRLHVTAPAGKTGTPAP